VVEVDGLAGDGGGEFLKKMMMCLGQGRRGWRGRVGEEDGV
jgi:hypothetical protein